MNEDDIYTTVPDENIDKDYDDRLKIRDFLKKNTGKFFVASKIAEAVDFPVRGTQVEVRKAITELIEIDHEPIVAVAKGFGYATNQRMLELYVERLEQRKQGLQRRINAVKKIRVGQ